VRTSTNTSLIPILGTSSQCPASPASTTRSRITLSQSSSVFGNKEVSEQSQRRVENNCMHNYTPMSVSSVRSRNTPFSIRSYSSTSHTSFRNISPVIVKSLINSLTKLNSILNPTFLYFQMIFGFRPNKEKVIQKV